MRESLEAMLFKGMAKISCQVGGLKDHKIFLDPIALCQHQGDL